MHPEIQRLLFGATQPEVLPKPYAKFDNLPRYDPSGLEISVSRTIERWDPQEQIEFIVAPSHFVGIACITDMLHPFFIKPYEADQPIADLFHEPFMRQVIGTYAVLNVFEAVRRIDGPEIFATGSVEDKTARSECFVYTIYDLNKMKGIGN